MRSLITYTLPRYNFLPRMTPPEKSTLRTASLAFVKSVYSSTAFANAFAFVSPLVSIPSQTKRMYLNSSSSACGAEAAAADYPRTCYAAADSVEAVTRERPLDEIVWKPRAERMASDSFVDTILFRLSAVSILSEDCKTGTRFPGNALCSYPGFGPEETHQ